MKSSTVVVRVKLPHGLRAFQRWHLFWTLVAAFVAGLCAAAAMHGDWVMLGLAVINVFCMLAYVHDARVVRFEAKVGDTEVDAQP